MLLGVTKNQISINWVIKHLMADAFPGHAIAVVSNVEGDAQCFVRSLGEKCNLFVTENFTMKRVDYTVMKRVDYTVRAFSAEMEDQLRAFRPRITLVVGDLNVWASASAICPIHQTRE